MWALAEGDRLFRQRIQRVMGLGLRGDGIAPPGPRLRSEFCPSGDGMQTRPAKSEPERLQACGTVRGLEQPEGPVV